MTAWPAARELRIEGFAEAPIGVALIAAAIARGAPVLLTLGALAALLLLAAYPMRWQQRMLEDAEAVPLDAVPATLAQTLLRRAPLAVVSAICLTSVAWISPLMMGLAGAVLVGGAVTAFLRATRIARFERAHAARVVRVPQDTFDRDCYFVAH